ncbi:MAG: efflux transporter periplasmic adaptor subunit [Hydrogenophilales bacterium 16-64-46]|nr:MAG: efflux transporter periplasmic adaptor subunit [Hydrogenophilales bacterium 12-64-13]OYZ06638.1 MAG: efflux transporter periplasmic adaptor subunit [Hydrogenophilales bacterium 16-64-46]OZA39346.1 MAG: efflux transporter periplasmic adaptor subunit [Hydrogenophilales bacterium 17-64-34]HQS98910.1 efflux RND transporter periplasmic adaptor subunit [Thiobacillus sp.]
MSVVSVVSCGRALGAGLILCLATVAPLRAADTLPLSAAQQRNLGIAVSPAVVAAVSPTLTHPARVSLSPAHVRVLAAAGAALVVQMHVQAGDRVKRGAPVVTLSMPGLAEAHSQLTQARLKAQLAADNAARDEKLHAEGLIAESRLRATRAEAQSARAAQTAAQAALTMLGDGKVSGSRITLTAPISGVVIESSAEPGQRVDAGMALAKLADLSKLMLEIPLSPALARPLAVGQRVTLVGSAASGRVTTLLPQVNAAQSVLVRASLVDPQGLLRAGQSVEAMIEATSAAQSLAIPAVAVVWQNARPFVFVQTAGGFAPTPVTLIRQNAREAEVTGLAAGSRVAVKGVAALKAQWLGE